MFSACLKIDPTYWNHSINMHLWCFNHRLITVKVHIKLPWPLSTLEHILVKYDKLKAILTQLTLKEKQTNKKKSMYKFSQVINLGI